jgi:hypothetical protein
MESMATGDFPRQRSKVIFKTRDPIHLMIGAVMARRRLQASIER